VLHLWPLSAIPEIFEGLLVVNLTRLASVPAVGSEPVEKLTVSVALNAPTAPVDDSEVVEPAARMAGAEAE
jgi:hypothetical protein